MKKFILSVLLLIIGLSSIFAYTGKKTIKKGVNRSYCLELTETNDGDQLICYDVNDVMGNNVVRYSAFLVGDILTNEQAIAMFDKCRFYFGDLQTYTNQGIFERLTSVIKDYLESNKISYNLEITSAYDARDYCRIEITKK